MDALTLPPLTRQFPKWSRTGLLIKKPSSVGERVVSKFKVKKTGSSDIIQNVNGDPILRVAQLEQNIRFLQEQHHLMLTGLHREIETLKHKNRDLQLQLVFAKSNSINEKTTPPSEEPSAEDETKEQGESDAEKCVRLEKELAAAKTALETSIARTTALQNLLQHHKIQESQESNQRNAIAENWSGVGQSQGQGSSHDGEARLQVRLEEAEQLVRRLRAESQHQRRELQAIKSSLNANGRGNGSGRPAGPPGGNGGNNGYRGGGVQNVFHKLPPLQQQQQQQQQQQHFVPHHQSREYHNWNRGNRKSMDKPEQGNSQGGSSEMTPDLSVTNLQYSSNNGNSGANQNHQRRGNNSGYGNNFYYRNNDRNYRSYREGEDVQYKNYNTPADHSDGENEPANDIVKTSSYRNKRNHNRYHDKS